MAVRRCRQMESLTVSCRSHRVRYTGLLSLSLWWLTMKLASQFNVAAAPDQVFSLFFDADTMRICLPGCEELVRVDEKTYRGSLTNEVAHMKFRAAFSAEIQSVTPAAEPNGSSVVHAVLRGEDRRLGSTVKIDATMTVAPDGDESRISYELEMAMWGKLGRLGESIIRRRSMEAEKQFAVALAAVCAGEVPAAPVATTSAIGAFFGNRGKSN
ncbi:hypothetical protein E3T43_08500 [Cryobacterium sp. Hh7]|nr:hypothetical protein E3T43_08500 [Cryobacterium sp. Hh7]